jgi:hypothetical protein
MKKTELTPEEERARQLEYLKYTVEDHIRNYGEDHAITIEAKEELKKFEESV